MNDVEGNRDKLVDELKLDYVKLLHEMIISRFAGIETLTYTVLRSLILLNGGALVSLFTLLGHDSQMKVDQTRLIYSFAAFTGGLVLTLLSSACAFFAQNLLFQADMRETHEIRHSLINTGLPWPEDENAISKRDGRKGAIYRNWAIGLAFGALGCFIGGCTMAFFAALP